MRLEEIDLSPAVEFHEELNPALWANGKMLPDVREKLLKIAKDFQEFINVSIYDILDVTVSGSNAAFTYTPNSDIDLHLVVMIPEDHDQELRQLFDSKKYQYNETFDFKIRGYDVELYVQDAKQEHHSMGIYSIKRDAWISEPKQVKASIDDASVEEKYKSYKARIASALESHDMYKLQRVWDSIKDMRKAGLARAGEFSVENLTFKLLRAEGDLQDIRTCMTAIKTQQMSLEDI